MLVAADIFIFGGWLRLITLRWRVTPAIAGRRRRNRRSVAGVRIAYRRAGTDLFCGLGSAGLPGRKRGSGNGPIIAAFDAVRLFAGGDIVGAPAGTATARCECEGEARNCEPELGIGHDCLLSGVGEQKAQRLGQCGRSGLAQPGRTHLQIDGACSRRWPTSLLALIRLLVPVALLLAWRCRDTTSDLSGAIESHARASPTSRLAVVV